MPDAQNWFAHDPTKNVKLWVPLENVFLPKTLHSTQLLKHFQKELFFTEGVLLGEQNASVANLHKKLAKCPKQIFSGSKINVKKTTFFKRKDIFPLNIPNVQKIPKNFYNEMFRSKKILFSRKFFRKCRVQFWQPCRKKPSTSKKISLRSESHDEKSYYPIVFIKNVSFKKVSRKKIFSWHVKCNFVTLDKTTAPSLQINLGEKRKTPEKQVILQKKLSSIKIFFWTCRFLFWQHFEKTRQNNFFWTGFPKNLLEEICYARKFLIIL